MVQTTPTTESQSKPAKKPPNRTAFKKGEKKPNQGKRGPNKLTVALKDMILGALNDAGGQAYLKRQAEENPGPFMALVGKVLPTTLAGDPQHPVKIEHALRPQMTPEQWLAAHGIKP